MNETEGATESDEFQQYTENDLNARQTYAQIVN